MSSQSAAYFLENSTKKLDFWLHLTDRFSSDWFCLFIFFNDLIIIWFFKKYPALVLGNKKCGNVAQCGTFKRRYVANYRYCTIAGRAHLDPELEPRLSTEFSSVQVKVLSWRSSSQPGGFCCCFRGVTDSLAQLLQPKRKCINPQIHTHTQRGNTHFTFPADTPRLFCYNTVYFLVCLILWCNCCVLLWCGAVGGAIPAGSDEAWLSALPPLSSFFCFNHGKVHWREGKDEMKKNWKNERGGGAHF